MLIDLAREESVQHHGDNQRDRSGGDTGERAHPPGRRLRRVHGAVALILQPRPTARRGADAARGRVELVAAVRSTARRARGHAGRSRDRSSSFPLP